MQRFKKDYVFRKENLIITETRVLDDDFLEESKEYCNSIYKSSWNGYKVPIDLVKEMNNPNITSDLSVNSSQDLIETKNNQTVMTLNRGTPSVSAYLNGRRKCFKRKEQIKDKIVFAITINVLSNVDSDDLERAYLEIFSKIYTYQKQGHQIDLLLLSNSKYRGTRIISSIFVENFISARHSALLTSVEFYRKLMFYCKYMDMRKYDDEFNTYCSGYGRAESINKKDRKTIEDILNVPHFQFYQIYDYL